MQSALNALTQRSGLHNLVLVDVLVSKTVYTGFWFLRGFHGKTMEQKSIKAIVIGLSINGELHTVRGQEFPMHKSSLVC